MFKKLLLVSVLFSASTFAQQPHGTFDLAELDVCVNYAMNYSMFVYVAHETKTREVFMKFVEQEIAGQDDASLAPMIRKAGEEAWKERNVSPSIAGMSVFKQCEQLELEQLVPSAPQGQPHQEQPQQPRHGETSI